MSKKIKRLVGFCIGIILAVGLDQWTKNLAVANLKGNTPFVIIADIFELLYSENRGAAFGILQGQRTFFVLIVALVMAAVIYGMYRMPVSKKYLPLEFCLILIASGAIGNMIDRIRLGYVVDFIYFKLIDFPIFNVADCYVTVSTAILMCLLLFVYKEEDLKVFDFKKQDEGEA